MKTIGKFLTILSLFLLAATAVQADQYGPYGGPKPSPDILIDKLVAMPHEEKGGTDYTYLDNISADDYRFKPYSIIFFKVIVKNTSQRTLHNVVVRDFAPDFIELFENPGSLDGRTLVINVGTLEPNESREYVIRARAFAQENLPADKGILCPVNRVRVDSDEVADEDTAQLCIEKQVLGAEKVPQAGAEDGILIIGSAIALATVGFKLRKVSA